MQIEITLDDSDCMRIRIPNEITTLNAIKDLPGRCFDFERKIWLLPAYPKSIQQLLASLFSIKLYNFSESSLTTNEAHNVKKIDIPNKGPCNSLVRSARSQLKIFVDSGCIEGPIQQISEGSTIPPYPLSKVSPQGIITHVGKSMEGDIEPVRFEPTRSQLTPAQKAGRDLLEKRFHEAIKVRHYSPRTSQAYLNWVRKFLDYYRPRRLADLDDTDINAYLTNLAVNNQVSASTQNQALAALLFLFRDIVGRQIVSSSDLVRAKKSERLPVVFTREEV
jgi:hypothetical protein